MDDGVTEQVVRRVTEGVSEGKSAQQVLDTVIKMIVILRDGLDRPSLDPDLPGQKATGSSQMSYMTLAGQLIKERALRTRHIDHSLFGEPTWDMLLDLFHCAEAGREVSVSSLCIASCVPGTTALRYISWLEEQNLIVRHKDQQDGRRIFVALAHEAWHAIASYLEEVARLRGIRLYQAPSCPQAAPSEHAAYLRRRPQ
jgi:DNA-binding MarR family transcriptional regulator